MKNKRKTIFTTLGFQDKTKNPLEFIKSFKRIPRSEKFYEYYIIGNIEKNTFKKIKKLTKDCKNIFVKNRYLDGNEYKMYLIKSDVIVIPGGKNYEYMSSGIIWDCFSYQKIFFAPNNPLNKSYLKDYKVGLIYKKHNLTSLIKKLKVLKKNVQQEYAKLYKDYSFKRNTETFKKILF